MGAVESTSSGELEIPVKAGTRPLRSGSVVLPLVAVALIGLVGVVALAWVGWPASDLRKGDFLQFYVGAQLVLKGASPYDVAWWDAYLANQPTVISYVPGVAPPYPLWTFILFAPLGLLPLAVAAAAWLVGQLIAVFVALVAVARSLGLDRNSRGTRLLIALVFVSEPIWFLLISGNLTGFVFGAFALAVAAALEGRYRLSGSCLALVMMKPQSFLLLVPLMFLGLPKDGRRPFVFGGLTVAIPLIAASFVLQPSWPLGWAVAVSGLQSTTGSNATGWTLGSQLAGWLPIALVAVAPVALVAWWRVRRPPFVDLVAGATPISVFVAPHGWSHEHLYLLVPAAIVAARLGDRAASSARLAAVALIFCLGVLPWILLVTPRRGEELLALVPLACFAIVVWVSRTNGLSAAAAPIPQDAARA